MHKNARESIEHRACRASSKLNFSFRLQKIFKNSATSFKMKLDGISFNKAYHYSVNGVSEYRTLVVNMSYF